MADLHLLLLLLPLLVCVIRYPHNLRKQLQQVSQLLLVLVPSEELALRLLASTLRLLRKIFGLLLFISV